MDRVQRWTIVQLVRVSMGEHVCQFPTSDMNAPACPVIMERTVNWVRSQGHTWFQLKARLTLSRSMFT